MIEPQPNSITHLCCLITGDRFYFWNDKSKKVWELKWHTQIKIRGKFVKLSVCTDDTGNSQRFDANRVIMFLRRTKPVIKRKRYFSIEKYFA